MAALVPFAVNLTALGIVGTFVVGLVGAISTIVLLGPNRDSISVKTLKDALEVSDGRADRAEAEAKACREDRDAMRADLDRCQARCRELEAGR